MDKKLGQYIIYVAIFVTGEIISFWASSKIKEYKKENRQPSDNEE